MSRASCFAACGEAARHSSEQAQASLARVSSCFWLLHHNLSGLRSYLDVAPGRCAECSPALHRCGGPLRYVLHNFLIYDDCKYTNDPLYINAKQRRAKFPPSSFGATWTLPLCVAPSALHRCGRASEVSPARQLAIQSLQIH